eukprot:GDKJ01042834.1.p1 GENE.GDKJ01042834.1~~GDKJ01042834.1.p1  ORF type:complete len:1104 (+),score=339.73 GDKJ01042834.1:1-3312(+)
MGNRFIDLCFSRITPNSSNKMLDQRSNCSNFNTKCVATWTEEEHGILSTLMSMIEQHPHNSSQSVQRDKELFSDCIQQTSSALKPILPNSYNCSENCHKKHFVMDEVSYNDGFYAYGTSLASKTTNQNVTICKTCGSCHSFASVVTNNGMDQVPLSLLSSSASSSNSSTGCIDGHLLLPSLLSATMASDAYASKCQNRIPIDSTLRPTPISDASTLHSSSACVSVALHLLLSVGETDANDSTCIPADMIANTQTVVKYSCSSCDATHSHNHTPSCPSVTNHAFRNLPGLPTNRQLKEQFTQELLFANTAKRQKLIGNSQVEIPSSSFASASCPVSCKKNITAPLSPGPQSTIAPSTPSSSSSLSASPLVSPVTPATNSLSSSSASSSNFPSSSTDSHSSESFPKDSKTLLPPPSHPLSPLQSFPNNKKGELCSFKHHPSCAPLIESFDFSLNGSAANDVEMFLNSESSNCLMNSANHTNGKISLLSHIQQHQNNFINSVSESLASSAFMIQEVEDDDDDEEIEDEESLYLMTPFSHRNQFKRSSTSFPSKIRSRTSTASLSVDVPSRRRQSQQPDSCLDASFSSGDKLRPLMSPLPQSVSDGAAPLVGGDSKYGCTTSQHPTVNDHALLKGGNSRKGRVHQSPSFPSFSSFPNNQQTHKSAQFSSQFEINNHTHQDTKFANVSDSLSSLSNQDASVSLQKQYNHSCVQNNNTNNNRDNIPPSHDLSDSLPNKSTLPSKTAVSTSLHLNTASPSTMPPSHAAEDLSSPASFHTSSPPQNASFSSPPQAPPARIPYESNVRLPLGEHGRCELKGLIGDAIKQSAETRAKVMAIAKLKCATISQLLHMAFVCDLWNEAVAISERFVESRARAALEQSAANAAGSSLESGGGMVSSSSASSTTKRGRTTTANTYSSSASAAQYNLHEGNSSSSTLPPRSSRMYVTAGGKQSSSSSTSSSSYYNNHSSSSNNNLATNNNHSSAQYDQQPHASNLNSYSIENSNNTYQIVNNNNQQPLMRSTRAAARAAVASALAMRSFSSSSSSSSSAAPSSSTPQFEVSSADPLSTSCHQAASATPAAVLNSPLMGSSHNLMTSRSGRTEGMSSQFF